MLRSVHWATGLFMIMVFLAVDRVPLPGLESISMVTVPLKSATSCSDASYTVARTGVMTWPTCTVWGSSVKTRWVAPPGGGATQVIAKVACAVAPDGTVTVSGSGPLTAQFAATPLKDSEWSPAETLLSVIFALMPIRLLVPPSSVTVYPSGSRFAPVVLVVIVRLPVGGGGGGTGVTLNGSLSAIGVVAPNAALRV